MIQNNMRASFQIRLIAALMGLIGVGYKTALADTLPYIVVPTTGVTDIGAQINASIAANGPAKYLLPPGHYSSATTINPPTSVTLECAGTGNVPLGNSRGTCVISFAAGVDGYKCNSSANGSSLKGISFYSLNTSAGSNNGINIGCSRFSGSDLVVQKFGQDGIHFDSSATGAGNSNHWILQNIQSDANKRDGYFWNGSDVNAGQCFGCSSAINGRYGFNNQTGGKSNTMIGAISNAEGVGSYNLGSYNVWITPYCEGSATDTMHINGTNNIIMSVLFGGCVITEAHPGSDYLFGFH
jgi:hypothetical protein